MVIPHEKMIRIVGRWTITCEFECIQDVAASSSIKPMQLPDGSYDIVALEEYEDFVINLLGIFDRANFEVIEERKSPYSQSYYFDLVKKDQVDNKSYNYILYVRVSDHSLSPQKVSEQNNWYSLHAESQKQSTTKSKQKWKLKRVTVNKDTYLSYDDALDDLEKRFESMQ